jgi:superfamily II DNA or RNA helicase
MFQRKLAQSLKTFCLHAWPGAGKTKFAACAFRTAQNMDVADKLLWVVPSSNLKRDIADHERSRDLWAEGIAAVHDIQNAIVEEAIAGGRYVWPQDKDAWLVTYHQIASNPELFAALCRNFRVMVVLDEIHHVRDGNVWGESIEHAAEHARMILPMSGTLFTSDGGKIPFVDYSDRLGEDGNTYRYYKPDYSFGMVDALKCQPGESTPSIRPLTYIKVNAMGEFTYRNLENDKTFTQIVDLKDDDAKLKPLLSIRSEMVRQMLKAGITALDEYRGTESDQKAGGLIVCMNGQHARQVADFLRETFGESPLVVLHDTDGASDAIDQFRRSDTRWLVTVRMVSEGVDIRRLRVGVYLTNYVTYLFLIQWLGRMWRWNPNLHEDQQGTVIIPAQTSIVSWVSELEKTTYESIVKEAGDSPLDEAAGSGPQLSINVLEDLQTVANIDGGFMRSIEFHADTFEQAKLLHRKSNGMLSVGNIAAVLELQRDVKVDASVPEVVENVKRNDDVRRLRQIIGQIRVQMQKNPPDDWNGENPYEYINGKLNRATGIKSFSESIATDLEVKNRKEAALRLLGIIKGI